MKVLVFVDHDIICRHFLMNGVLTPVVRNADVRFVFPDDDSRRVKLDPGTLSLGAPFERLPIDPVRVQMWRWQLFADQLKWRPGRAEREIRRIRRRFLHWKSSVLLTMAGLPLIEPLFLKSMRRKLAQRPNRALDELLDRERPDVLVHPSVLEGVFINDLVEQGAARGIPVVVAMNSWDNPSTKRAVVGQPDRLLVWGPQTAEHAKRFMHMPPQDVLSFGAAQFDVFREQPRTDRAAFAAEHDCDPALPMVLFAGSSAQTDEFGALSSLDAAIEDGRIPPATIIYRPHPWGRGGRDGGRISGANWKHVRIHSTTRDYVARLATEKKVGMTLPDYRDTHDVLVMVDVVVSPMSTILLEAMLHGKPIVVFTPSDADGSQILNDRLPFVHFDDFLAVEAVNRAVSRDELIGLIARLVDPAVGPAMGERSRNAAHQFVTPFEEPWGDRLLALLRQIVRPGVQRAATE